MIYAGTYSTVKVSLEWSTSALVGTLGVRVIDATGATIVARTTSGITEPVAGSAMYIATVDLTALTQAPAPGHYFVFWDDGATTPGHVAMEDLILHQTTTLSAALRAVGVASASHNAEDISVGFFIA